MSDNIRLGVIGGGVMAEAIVSRLISEKRYEPTAILISEPQAQRRLFWQETYQVSVTDNNHLALQAQEIVLLAIKPQVLDAVAKQLVIASAAQAQPLILSILAGVPLKRLEAVFPNMAVIRSMPNTPATVGSGITAITAGNSTDLHHLNLAKTVFAAIGEVVTVPESLMDSVTGLSGSGPAYVALMIEAMADGGVAVGLPRAIAAQLALQTVLGTAQLLKESQWHPAQLKDRVASPGGTTIAAIAQLEKSGFRTALIEAVKAAHQRAQELG